jgi:hypothetical protein
MNPLVEDIFCSADEYVSSHVCVACPAGTRRPFWDDGDASGDDTYCKRVLATLADLVPELRAVLTAADPSWLAAIEAGGGTLEDPCAASTSDWQQPDVVSCTPAEEGMMDGRIYVDLSGSGLSGSIPEALATSRISFNLQDNKLSGVLPLGLLRRPSGQSTYQTFIDGNNFQLSPCQAPQVPAAMPWSTGDRWGAESSPYTVYCFGKAAGGGGGSGAAHSSYDSLTDSLYRPYSYGSYSYDLSTWRAEITATVAALSATNAALASTVATLQAALVGAWDELSEGEIEDLCGQADQDNDGLISKEEFTHLLTSS